MMRTVLLLLLAGSTCGGAAAQIGIVADALARSNETWQTISTYDTTAKRIVAQESPTVERSHWSQLVGQYRDITKQMNQAKNHTWDNANSPTPAALTDEHQFDCSLFPLRVQWFRANLDSQRAYLDRRIGMASQIDREITHVDEAFQMADYLRDAMDKIVTIPEVGSKFAADWFSVAIDLPHALGDLRSALIKQRSDNTNAIDDTRKEIAADQRSLQADNLQKIHNSCKQ